MALVAHHMLQNCNYAALQRLLGVFYSVSRPYEAEYQMDQPNWEGCSLAVVHRLQTPGLGSVKTVSNGIKIHYWSWYTHFLQYLLNIFI